MSIMGKQEKNDNANALLTYITANFLPLTQKDLPVTLWLKVWCQGAHKSETNMQQHLEICQ